MGVRVKIKQKGTIMKNSTSLDAINQLFKNPFFTADEAKKIGVYPALLGYYIKTGRLKRLSRGIYQGQDYQSSLKNFQWKDLIEAVNSVPGGVICLISALAIYNITEEIPRQHWIAISHSTSIKRGNAIKIVRFRDLGLGKTEINLEGISIPIFDCERTIIDSFRLLSRETAIKALKMALCKKGVERLNLKKLQFYAQKLRVDITPYLMTATI